jgi:hypothetical protein
VGAVVAVGPADSGKIQYIIIFFNMSPYKRVRGFKLVIFVFLCEVLIN